MCSSLPPTQWHPACNAERIQVPQRYSLTSGFNIAGQIFLIFHLGMVRVCVAAQSSPGCLSVAISSMVYGTRLPGVWLRAPAPPRAARPWAFIHSLPLGLSVLNRRLVITPCSLWWVLVRIQEERVCRVPDSPAWNRVSVSNHQLDCLYYDTAAKIL